MDLDKFINDNLDEILDDIDNKYLPSRTVKFNDILDVQSNYENWKNEDDDEDDKINELIEDENNKKFVAKENQVFYSNLNKNSNINNNSPYLNDEPNLNNVNLNLDDNKSIMETYNKMLDGSNIENDFSMLNDEHNIKDNLNNKFSDEYVRDDGFYYIHILAIFTKYFNNKFDKNQHFFAGIQDQIKDTNDLMELFIGSTTEYKYIKNINPKFNLCFYFLKEEYDEVNNIIIDEDEDDDNEDKIKLNEILKNKKKELEIKKKERDDDIYNLFSDQYNQVYMLECVNGSIYTPSLFICMNYIFDNNLITTEWNIFNMKNL